MGRMINITGSDGVRICAYVAEPEGDPRGGLIVGQELFGVNAHIRSICDRWAAEGFVALAPQFYDRVQPGGFAVGYSDDERVQAFTILQYLDLDRMMIDCAAARDWLSPHGKVGMVGYCSGGSTAWYAAARLEGLACSVGYYAGRVAELVAEQPRCPVMLHWGDIDHTIPMADVRKVEAAHPTVISHVYEATEHGFNCDMRRQFNPQSADQAWTRTRDFLQAHIA
jgi:carboxymethylenebutenolidase